MALASRPLPRADQPHHFLPDIVEPGYTGAVCRVCGVGQIRHPYPTAIPAPRKPAEAAA